MSLCSCVAPRAYSEGATKYDMNTFWGRTLYFAESINPLFLFETERTLQRHQLLLSQWKAGQAKGVPDRELWHARSAVEQCVHPVSGDVIRAPFRMCAFLPLNFFIVPFMMAPSTVTSIGRTIFIQWFNQSCNAAVNYANRASESQPVREIAKAYSAAVLVACSGSLVATLMLRRVRVASTQGMLIRCVVPFFAVSAAAIVNLGAMRKNEWMSSGTGVQVRDEDGAVRGTSLVAGRDSFFKCSITRVVWNIPSMILPMLLMMRLLGCCALARRHPVAMEASLQVLGLTVGVPPALGVFNPVQSIKAKELEPQFHNLKRADGTPVVNFTYNKGL